MKLAKYLSSSGEVRIGSVTGESIMPLALSGGQYRTLFDILEEENPQGVAEFLADGSAAPLPLHAVRLLSPVDQQEIWAAGVTYKRSRTARMEESSSAASCYDRVYASARPELFFKATPHRVSGPGVPLRIREDAKWSVPEPELTLVLNSHCKLVGFTIGNDMSARDIEGENPLYLPQAKVYDGCCGLGPCITLVGSMPSLSEIDIALKITHAGQVRFEGRTSITQMARSLDDLVGWLSRDNSFPTGAMLLTGTGIVPEGDFTLQVGDVVQITIDGIGTLTNPVIQG